MPGNTDLKDSHVTDFYARADYPREQELSARRGGPGWKPRNNTFKVRQSQRVNEREEQT